MTKKKVQLNFEAATKRFLELRGKKLLLEASYEKLANFIKAELEKAADKTRIAHKHKFSLSTFDQERFDLKKAREKIEDLLRPFLSTTRITKLQPPVFVGDAAENAD